MQPRATNAPPIAIVPNLNIAMQLKYALETTSRERVKHGPKPAPRNMTLLPDAMVSNTQMLAWLLQTGSL